MVNKGYASTGRECDFAEMVSSVDVKENHYFPSLVFSFVVPGATDLNAHLLSCIRAERAHDRKGLHRSNHPGLGGWHSHNNLHKDLKYDELTQYILALGATISDKLGYHDDYILRIGTMWSIINPKGSSNQSHVHPDSLWSGVYYVQAPEKCGNISFTDPRIASVMCQPKFQPGIKRPRSCWGKVNFTPRPGKMLMFPSWLYHAVAPNLTEAKGDASERIIISFNMSQARRGRSDFTP